MALLEREGHTCLLLDASVEGWSEEQTLRKIFDFHPDYIAVYWAYDTYRQDFRFADNCSAVGEVIMVGPWSFCVPDLLYSIKRVHLMTFGEFEHTLLDIANDKSPQETKGLTYREDGEIITNSPRPLCSVEELDEIPFVSDVFKRFLNLKKYRQTSLQFPFLDVQSGRGCPHRCTYCVTTRAMQGGPSYRCRSVKNVVEELRWIENNLPQVKQIFFQDDCLTPKRARELSQTFLDEHFCDCWGGLARADLDLDTLKLMEESGCRTLHIGFESPIQKNLDIINKDITVEQYEQFCHNINKTKIWNNAAFMIFPWMTKEDVEYTVKWAKKMKIARLSFISAIPYPNTPYAEYIQQLKNERVKLLTWDESVELEKRAHKQYYLYHPWMWKQILSHPANWRNVASDAVGLLSSLR